MASEEEETAHFVDRTESYIGSPVPSQISRHKVLIREGSSVDADPAVYSLAIRSSSLSPKSQESSTSEAQRSEVNVEIDGFKETAYCTSETVVSSRVRTVYGRSLSGSTSSTGSDHRESGEDAHHVTEDSAFSDIDYAVGGVDQRERTPSDSYYISQTYQINSTENSSRSVTAMNSIKFRCSKDFELGAHGRGADGEAGEDQPYHFVDRFEDIIAGENPEKVGSPVQKQAKFSWYSIDQEDVHSLEKIKSAREDVQQLIESTYMVSDISDVIDDNHLGPESLKAKTETSCDNLLSRDTLTQEARGMEISTQNVETSDSLHFSSSVDNQAGKPKDFPADLKPPSPSDMDRESPPRLDYSPGMAIRSYALEELAEKKSRITPERVTTETTAFEFDGSSSSVDPVSDFTSQQSMSTSVPHLNRVDFSQARSKESEASLRTSTTQDIQMFKLTKIQKVSLPEGPHLGGENYVGGYPEQEMTQEEKDESLDKLIDLETIQASYRFHDVGMMQEATGICNLAFDDSDEPEPLTQEPSSSDFRSSSLNAQDQAKMEMPSLQSSDLSSASLAYQGLHAPPPNVERTNASSESSSNVLSETSVSTEMNTRTYQDMPDFAGVTTENQTYVQMGREGDWQTSTIGVEQNVMQMNRDRNFGYHSQITETSNLTYNAPATDSQQHQVPVEPAGNENVQYSSEQVGIQEEYLPEYVSQIIDDSTRRLEQLQRGSVEEVKRSQNLAQTIETKSFTSTSEDKSREVSGFSAFDEPKRHNAEEAFVFGQASRVIDSRDFQSEVIAQESGQLELSGSQSTTETIQRNVDEQYTDSMQAEQNFSSEFGTRVLGQGTDSQVYSSFASGSSTDSVQQGDVQKFSLEDGRRDLTAPSALERAEDRTQGMNTQSTDVAYSFKETDFVENVAQPSVEASLQRSSNEQMTSVVGGSLQVQQTLEKNNLTYRNDQQLRVDSVTDQSLRNIVQAQVRSASDQKISATRRVARPPVSVTRKFNANKKFEASLKSQGATLKSETITIDIYFDTPQFDLTLSDCWLRSHNSKWQFHQNFTKLLNEQTKEEYTELEDRTRVLTSLSKILNVPLPADPEISIASYLNKCRLREFVRYTTTRKTYTLQGMTIELELPEYGFWVGSVTASAPRINEAVGSIDAFWKSTGVAALDLLGA